MIRSSSQIILIKKFSTRLHEKGQYGNNCSQESSESSESSIDEEAEVVLDPNVHGKRGTLINYTNQNFSKNG